MTETKKLPLIFSNAFTCKKFQIKYISALVQIMAWRQTGDRPLSELMMVNSLTPICNTRSQSISPWFYPFVLEHSLQNEDRNSSVWYWSKRKNMIWVIICIPIIHAYDIGFPSVTCSHIIDPSAAEAIMCRKNWWVPWLFLASSVRQCIYHVNSPVIEKKYNHFILLLLLISI